MNEWFWQAGPIMMTALTALTTGSPIIAFTDADTGEVMGFAVRAM